MSVTNECILIKLSPLGKPELYQYWLLLRYMGLYLMPRICHFRILHHEHHQHCPVLVYIILYIDFAASTCDVRSPLY